MTRDNILLGSLWLSIVFIALWVGGTLYQMIVIVPLWTASPPESLRAFLTADYAHTVLNFFGPPFIAVRTVCLIVALAAGWRSVPHRFALSIALACWLIVVGFTLMYIYPMNDDLFVAGSSPLSDDATRELLRRWIVADRLRFAIGCVSFIALLHAFRLPLNGTVLRHRRP
jgi:Domain of unknown function (DUF1772)